MVYQHHRHNMHALVPVGDFLLQAAGLDRPTADDAPVRVRRLLAGVERGRPGDAARARGAPQGRRRPRPALLGRRRRRRARSAPRAGARGRGVHRRGALPPARGLRPPEPDDRRAARAACVGRLQTALDVDVDEALRRSDAAAAELRAAVPEEHRAAFDDLLGRGPARVPPARRAGHLQRDRGGRAPAPRAARARSAPPAARPGGGRRRRARGRAPTSSTRCVAGAEAPTAEELHAAGRRPRGAHPGRRAPPPRPAARRPRRPSTCSRRRWPG